MSSSINHLDKNIPSGSRQQQQQQRTIFPSLSLSASSSTSSGVPPPASTFPWKNKEAAAPFPFLTINSSTMSSSNIQEISEATTEYHESDDDLFTVPDMESAEVTHNYNQAINLSLASTGGGGAAPPVKSATTVNHNNNNNRNNVTVCAVPQDSNPPPPAGKRRRGRNPVDKEVRRVKRLLRNRVSAQQARERKKVYVHDLESKAKELHDRNMKLEEKISTLNNENNMLRKILLNTRRKMAGNVEPKCENES